MERSKGDGAGNASKHYADLEPSGELSPVEPTYQLPSNPMLWMVDGGDDSSYLQQIDESSEHRSWEGPHMIEQAALTESPESLPSIPSPPKVNSSFGSGRFTQESDVERSTATNSPGESRGRSVNDTFYEDRSLENRLHGVLNQQTPTVKTPKSRRSAQRLSRRNVARAAPTTGSKTRRSEETKKNSASLYHPSDEESPFLPSQRKRAQSSSSRLQQEVARLSHIVGELSIENERLRQNASSRSMEVADSSLSISEHHAVAECERLAHELEMAQAELLSQKETSTSKIQELKEKNAALEKENQEAADVIHSVEERYQGSQRQVQDLTNDKEEAQIELKRIMEANTTMQQSIDSLQNNVEALELEKAEDKDRVQAVSDKLQLTQQQLDNFRYSNEEAQIQLKNVRKEKESLQERVQSLTNKLEAANYMVEELTANQEKTKEELALSKKLLEDKCIQTDPPMVQSTSCQTEVPVTESADASTQTEVDTVLHASPLSLFSSHSLDQRSSAEEKKDESIHRHGTAVRPRRLELNESPMSGRLSRIRDSAERASLLQQHQREIAKLVADHGKEMERMAAAFESERQQMQEDANEEVDSRIKELKHRYDRKIADLRKTQRKELQKLEKETEMKATAATESVEVAMEQVAQLRRSGEHEHRKRLALEQTVKEITLKHEMEKKSLVEQHEKEVQSLRGAWEEDKDKLIGVIQKECNIVFDRTRSQSSPRCVSSEFFPDKVSVYEPSESGDALSPKSNSARSPRIANKRTPTFSDVGKSLRETEALVQSLLNKPVRP